MRILVIGSGAREHALVWALARDPDVTSVVCAPGNPGMSDLATVVPVDVADPDAVVAVADAYGVDLTVIGPELPLTRGVADLFRARGRAILGPTRAAAALESSKAFAKAFMTRHHVPTARYRLCDTPDEALGVLQSREFGFPVVVKADGLAAGKGVVVADDEPAAVGAVRAAMVDRRFGEAGARLVIEEFLEGREASFFVLTDGCQAMPLPPAQDHKRVLDGDRGPNTGGMGALAPSPLVDAQTAARVMREIVEPTLEGMRDEAREFRGFLYVGLMIGASGPKVVEFNVRMGDPEAQVVLPLVEEGLGARLAAAAAGELDAVACRVRDGAAVGVVLASAGYPGAYETGRTITGLEAAAAHPDVLIFHAGTARRADMLVTSGGRVLTVVGCGRDLSEARSRAYAAAEVIHFEGRHMRRDIGAKVIAA